MTAWSHDGVPLAAGATTPFASPRGIDAWNCKMPSMSHTTPKAIRKYVRLRGSFSPSLDTLNVFTRRKRLAAMSRSSATPMIHETLVSKALWRKIELTSEFVSEIDEPPMPGIVETPFSNQEQSQQLKIIRRSRI